MPRKVISPCWQILAWPRIASRGLATTCVILWTRLKPDRSLVFHHTRQFFAPFHKKKKNGEKVPRSLCIKFIFKLAIVLARCSLGHSHRLTYVLHLFVQWRSRTNNRQLSLRNMTPDFSRACHVTLARVFLHGYMKLDTLSILFTLAFMYMVVRIFLCNWSTSTCL